MTNIKTSIKKLIPIKIYNFLIKLKNYIRYPFVSEQEKAVIRFYETHSDKKRTQITLKKRELLFDLGGYKGDYTDDLLKNNPDVISYIFEPVKEYADNINKRFENNSNITVYSFGLSDSNQEININVKGESSSFIRDISPDVKENSKVKDIHEFLLENNIKEIGLMKINIEGSEYPLLERMIDTKDICKIKRLLVQFHYIDKNSYERMNKIWKELEKTHNLIWYFRPYVWEYWELKH